MQQIQMLVMKVCCHFCRDLKMSLGTLKVALSCVQVHKSGHYQVMHFPCPSKNLGLSANKSFSLLKKKGVFRGLALQEVLLSLLFQGAHSVGLMWWMLAREVLRMRGTISREHPWEVMPDLYFYRDPEEVGDLRKEVWLCEMSSLCSCPVVLCACC